MRRILRGLVAAALLFGGVSVVAPSANAVEPLLVVNSVSVGSCTNTTPVVDVTINPQGATAVAGIGYQITIGQIDYQYGDSSINGLPAGAYTLTLPAIQPETSVTYRVVLSVYDGGSDAGFVFSDWYTFTAGTNCTSDPDTDGDGFTDANDACPTVYSTTNGGCPPPNDLKYCTYKGKGKSLGWWIGVGNKHKLCPRR